MIRFARCAVLAVAASCVLSERVDVPLVTVEAAHPVTFELPAPASKTVLYSVHVTNTLLRNQSGCASNEAALRFAFGTYSTQTMRIGYSTSMATQKLFLGLNTSTVQVTVTSLLCTVGLEIFAKFYELTDRAFTTPIQLMVRSKDYLPGYVNEKVSLDAGPAAFITQVSMSPVSVLGCPAGPPTIGVQVFTHGSRYHGVVVEEGGPPVVLATNVTKLGQLGIAIYLNGTQASCKLTLAFEVQGFAVELGVTPAPATPAPLQTPHPIAIDTPQPTQDIPTPHSMTPQPTHMRTAQPEVSTSSDDDTLLIVMLTVFVGGTVVGLIVLAAACWWCRKNRSSTSQQEPAHGTSPDGQVAQV